jgi:hypothetical protein
LTGASTTSSSCENEIKSECMKVGFVAQVNIRQEANLSLISADYTVINSTFALRAEMKEVPVGPKVRRKEKKME